ncbi:hypothetical protein D9M71_496660 [compost metagenome]
MVVGSGRIQTNRDHVGIGGVASVFRLRVMAHGDRVTVGGFRSFPDGNATSAAGGRTYTSRQRVDTGRTVVVVVGALYAVVVHAVVVGLRGFQLSHVHCVAIGSTSG